MNSLPLSPPSLAVHLLSPPTIPLCRRRTYLYSSLPSAPLSESSLAGLSHRGPVRFIHSVPSCLYPGRLSLKPLAGPGITPSSPLRVHRPRTTAAIQMDIKPLHVSEPKHIMLIETHATYGTACSHRTNPGFVSRPTCSLSPRVHLCPGSAR